MSGVCVICSNSFGPDGADRCPNVLTTGCGHTFHAECFQEYMSRNRPLSCPKCRTTVAYSTNINDPSQLVEIIRGGNELGPLNEFGTLSSCPVCRRPFDLRDQKHDIVSITRCGHMCHQRCLQDWRAANDTCPFARCHCRIINRWTVRKFNLDERADSTNDQFGKIKPSKVQRTESVRIGELKLVVRELNARLEQLNVLHRKELNHKDEAYYAMCQSFQAKISELELASQQEQAATQELVAATRKLTASATVHAAGRQHDHDALFAKNAMLKANQQNISVLKNILDLKTKLAVEVQQKALNLAKSLNETKELLEKEMTLKTQYCEKWRFSATSLMTTLEQHKLAMDVQEAEHRASLIRAQTALRKEQAAKEKLRKALATKELSHRTLIQKTNSLGLELYVVNKRLKAKNEVTEETRRQNNFTETSQTTKTSHDKLKAAEATCQSTVNEVEDLKESLKAERERHRSKKDSHEAECRHLQKQVSRWKARCDSFKHQTSIVTGSLEALLNQLSVAKGANQSLRERCNNLEAEKQEMLKRIDDHDAIVEGQRVDHEAEIEVRELSRQAAFESLVKAEATLQKLRTDIPDYQLALEEARSEARAEVNVYKQSFLKMRRDIAGLRTALESARIQHRREMEAGEVIFRGMLQEITAMRLAKSETEVTSQGNTLSNTELSGDSTSDAGTSVTIQRQTAVETSGVVSAAATTTANVVLKDAPNQANLCSSSIEATSHRGRCPKNLAKSALQLARPTSSSRWKRVSETRRWSSSKRSRY